MTDFKIHIPDKEHKALRAYYRANETDSRKALRLALAHLIVREAHLQRLLLQSGNSRLQPLKKEVKK